MPSARGWIRRKWYSITDSGSKQATLVVVRLACIQMKVEANHSGVGLDTGRMERPASGQGR